MNPTLPPFFRWMGLLWLVGVHAGALAACGPYNVALYEHGILYQRAADGEWGGIDRDVVIALAERTGCTLHMALDSRPRIWAALEAGQLDMSVSGIPTPEREKYARFVTYFKTHNNVLLRADVADRVKTADGFMADTALRVAVVKSFKHGEQHDAWLDRLRSQGRVEQVAEFSGAWNLFRRGRVQAVVGLPTTWVPLLRRDLGSTPVRVLDWFPKEKPILAGMIFSRTRVSSADASLMDQALREMHRDGTLEAIYQRYVGAELAHNMVRF